MRKETRWGYMKYRKNTRPELKRVVDQIVSQLSKGEVAVVRRPERRYMKQFSRLWDYPRKTGKIIMSTNKRDTSYVHMNPEYHLFNCSSNRVKFIKKRR